jgi:hypothetical protein
VLSIKADLPTGQFLLAPFIVAFRLSTPSIGSAAGVALLRQAPGRPRFFGLVDAASSVVHRRLNARLF